MTVSQRIAREVRSAILEGQHAPHSRLPSYREICARYGASLNTVRRALDTLEKEGLLYRRERAGAFVRAPSTPPPTGPQCLNFFQAPQPPERHRFQADYLVGYTRALEHHNIKMRFIVCADNTPASESLLSDQFSFAEQGCVFADTIPPAILAWLHERSIPAVVHYYTPTPPPRLPPHHRVCINKVGAFFDATRHLLNLGHRRIGITSLRRLTPAPGPEYEGYASALRAAGLDPDPALCLPWFTEDPGRVEEPLLAFLRRPNRPTAIIAGNDATAIAILNAARQLGVSVPGQLSVVGYQDIPEAAAAVPPLTTMLSPKRLQGQTAVEMLLTAAGGDGEFKDQVIHCRLIERQSSAPPESR